MPLALALLDMSVGHAMMQTLAVSGSSMMTYGTRQAAQKRA